VPAGRISRFNRDIEVEVLRDKPVLLLAQLFVYLYTGERRGPVCLPVELHFDIKRSNSERLFGAQQEMNQCLELNVELNGVHAAKSC
jgi:hypothetical protein